MRYIASLCGEWRGSLLFIQVSYNYSKQNKWKIWTVCTCCGWGDLSGLTRPAVASDFTGNLDYIAQLFSCFSHLNSHNHWGGEDSSQEECHFIECPNNNIHSSDKAAVVIRERQEQSSFFCFLKHDHDWSLTLTTCLLPSPQQQSFSNLNEGVILTQTRMFPWT